MSRIKQKKLEAILDRFPVAACYLFGSQAGGFVTPLSDFDFAVLLQENIAKEEVFQALLDLQSELETVVGRGLADLVILNDEKTPLSLKYRVIKKGKLLYEKDELCRARFEHVVMREYLDRKYYFDRHVEISLKAFAQSGLG